MSGTTLYPTTLLTSILEIRLSNLSRHKDFADSPKSLKAYAGMAPLIRSRQLPTKSLNKEAEISPKTSSSWIRLHGVTL